MEASKTLQQNFIAPPWLVMLCSKGSSNLDTKACSKEMGCVLIPAQPNIAKKPPGYWSQASSAADRYYDTTQCECLVFGWALILLKPYFGGQRFQVRTEHAVIKWIYNLIDSTVPLSKLLLRLSESGHKVVHRVVSRTKMQTPYHDLQLLELTGHSSRTTFSV